MSCHDDFCNVYARFVPDQPTSQMVILIDPVKDLRNLAVKSKLKIFQAKNPGWRLNRFPK